MKSRMRLVVCCLCLLWGVPTRSLAMTVEEILLLKQNGVSEETIQMMLQSEMQSQDNIATGEKMGTRTIVRPGGQPAIVYSTGSDTRNAYDEEERLKEERAWEMLRHIIVDTRVKDDRGPRPEERRRKTED